MKSVKLRKDILKMWRPLALLSLLYVSHTYAEQSDIHIICEQQPRKCLIDIQPKLADETFQSRIWFQYKLYQIDALFELLEIDQLFAEISPWVNAEDIPLKFRIAVEIYYAKILQGRSNEEQASVYLQRAIRTLQDVNDVSPDPMLEVQIANTLNSLGKYQKGYDLLKPLEDKYANRHMPQFKHELYENLGHFSYRLGNLEEHLSYRQKSRRWASELNNNVQLAISTYNLARAYQMLEQFDRAFEYFLVAEQMNALGKSDQNMIWYRRAEMSLSKSDVDKAKYYFSRVNRNTPTDAYIQLFNQLEQKINMTAAR